MSDGSPDFESDRFAGRGDDFYALLMAAHEGLAPDESVKLNARLILLLANQVGDVDILEKILMVARKSVGGDKESGE